MENREIIIYKNQDEDIQIEVHLDHETVWLTQEQIANLFERDRSVITKHLQNIFKEKELDEKLVCANFAQTTKHGAIQGKTQEKEVKFYNLDAIISVGYRVNSKRGTQFRQWATQRLKDYLVQGYAINEKRLEELGKIIKMIEKSAQKESLEFQEAKGLLNVLSDYTKSFILLNQYDRQHLRSEGLNQNITYHIEYEEAKLAITELKRQLMSRQEASELFGNEKDQGFTSSLQTIIQTFGGQYLYPSIEEQAAHLLYFVIKNHSFTDGNKRIGAFLFVWFLEKNKHLFKQSGELKINDNGLTAIALLVAQSDPKEKELMIQLIIQLVK